MQTGAITGYIDVAQVTLYVFWAFFAGLIFWLRREDKREGYPLESDRSGTVMVQGWPPMPRPKTFLVRDGHTYQAPPGNIDERTVTALAESWPGSPLRPAGNPMLAGIGPSSWVEREDRPDETAEGENRMVPLRAAPNWGIERNDPDPRGMDVIAADGIVAGTVTDVWVDRSEPQIRYLETQVSGPAGPRSALIPMTLLRIDRRRRHVKVNSILSHQFADVPRLKNPDQITLREEDQIQAYFGGGHLYADASRTEPLL